MAEGELRSRPPTMRDLFGRALASMGMDPRLAADVGGRLANLAEMTPGLGQGISAREAAQNFSVGNLLGGGLSMLGVVPFASNPLGRSFRKLTQREISKARKYDLESLIKSVEKKRKILDDHGVNYKFKDNRLMVEERFTTYGKPGGRWIDATDWHPQTFKKWLGY